MAEFVIACDEGTGSARSVLYDEEQHVVQTFQRPLASTFPDLGWVEQDAEAIWQAQAATLRETLAYCDSIAGHVAALGITNQRETIVLWDRATGKPLYPAIVWQCRRTTTYCAELTQAGHDEQISQTTGLLIDPYFSASKIRWLLEHVEDAQARAATGELAVGTVDSWLIYRLTAGQAHVIDRTNASRTSLMDLQSAHWSQAMLDLFQIPKEILPTIVPSTGIVAHTAASVIGKEIPISGVAGDQQAALVGQGCAEPGEMKCTYGTGCFLLMHTGHEPPFNQEKLLATTAASRHAETHEFALEGSVFAGGSVMRWLRDQVGLISDVQDTAAVATSIEGTDGVYVVPAFAGLGAPYWRPDVRGIVTGITQNATRSHIVRAALESIAYQTYQLVEATEQASGLTPSALRTDGGAAENNFLMQFQADLLDRPVIRPFDLESTARGAAHLAGTAVGLWSFGEHADQEVQVFEPHMRDDERQQCLAGWEQAVAQAIGT